jgi:membrane fusion protein
MGDSTELFRREALHAQTKHLIGEVVLSRPLSFTWLTLVSLVFAAAIIAFLALASYTRKEEKMVSDPNLPPRFSPAPYSLLRTNRLCQPIPMHRSKALRP